MKRDDPTVPQTRGRNRTRGFLNPSLQTRRSSRTDSGRSCDDDQDNDRGCLIKVGRGL